MNHGEGPLRFGILGAAKIAPNALIKPARQVAGVEVRAVAARSIERARAFAAQHGIAQVYDDYAALIAASDIDAVYIALPNSAHAEWSIAALQAGKHVLCEKPLASNAAEAHEIAQVAAGSECVSMEAFHNLYHPLAVRMREIVASGEIGSVQQVRGVFNTIMRRREDIRFEYALAGGATMDLGCYLVSLLRFVLGCGVDAAEPVVLSASAELMKANVDARMRAELHVAQGEGRSDVRATLECAMQRWRLPSIYFEVVGERGKIAAINPILPQIWHRLTVTTPNGRRVESLGRKSTYLCQLEAFTRAVRDGHALHTDAANGVRNMQVIDAIYRAAGLPTR